jgi:hypothetical protein
MSHMRPFIELAYYVAEFVNKKNAEIKQYKYDDLSYQKSNAYNNNCDGLLLAFFVLTIKQQ